MKRVIYLILVLTICLAAQDEKTKKKDGEPVYFVAVEKMPEIIGGMQALASNVIYPGEAKEKGIEGKVFLRVKINEKGEVDSIAIIKGAHELLDQAAIEAVKKTKFTPGEQRGKKVKVEISVPIMFKLAKEKKDSEK